MRSRLKILRWIGAALLLQWVAVRHLQAFWGVGDTSFVTVIANPAEAANWAAELDRMSAEISAAQGTLQVAGDLRTYAGDPRAAVGALPDLLAVSSGAAAVGGAVATQADLSQAWQSLGSAGQSAGEASLLERAGSGDSMSVFGQQQGRNLALYVNVAADSAAVAQLHGQAAREQAVRGLVAAGLASAWERFRAATTESSKQAILAEISQLQSQDQLMASRRRTLLDDLALADRDKAAESGARAKADDEQALAESAALNAAAASRVQAAESQRLSTLGKPAQSSAAPDYSGIRLWTTADAGSSSN